MYVQVIQLRAEAADARFRATRAEQEVAQKDMEVKQLQVRAQSHDRHQRSARSKRREGV